VKHKGTSVGRGRGPSPTFNDVEHETGSAAKKDLSSTHAVVKDLGGNGLAQIRKGFFDA